MFYRLFALYALLMSSFSSPRSLSRPTVASGATVVGHPILLQVSGGRVDWWPDPAGLIAFDKLDADGYYDVYTMLPDGSATTCVTCGNPMLPAQHLGNPAWHPSGQWIVLQAQKPNGQPSLQSTPGYGVNCDLWLVNTQTQQAYQLTHTPNNNASGVLHAHFSADGKRLSWSQMVRNVGPGLRQEYGYWQLKIADFIVDASGPHVGPVQDVTPGPAAFYENHGFSPDGSTLIFSSNQPLLQPNSTLDVMNIFTLNLATAQVQQLTTDQVGYNEHASFSPDGKHILWMHGSTTLHNGTDFWIMRADGTHKVQITTFNQVGSPYYMGHPVEAADSSWSRSGTQLVGYVQNNLAKQTGFDVLINLTPTGASLPYSIFMPFG